MKSYDNTYIKLFRKFTEWEWYHDSNTVRVFLHCLLKANYADKKWQGVDIKRKSFITSIEKMSKALHLSHQNIRTALKHLEKTGEINKQSNKHHTVVTVCNYDNYQYDYSQPNKQLTNSQQTPNKRLTTTKNNKEEEELKEIYKEKSEEFLIVLNDFIKFRKEIKKPMTTKAIKILINKLNKLSTSESVQIEIMEQSIFSNWQSVYELKKDITHETETGSVEDVKAKREKRLKEMKNESN